MRRPISMSTVALAAGLVLPLAARAAIAQPATALRPTSDVATAAVAAAPAVRTLAVYRIGRAAPSELPARVTVADSAGTLVARYRVDGGAGERTMVVTVMHADLVLQADTPSGVLTLLLQGQNDATGAPLTGRWWVGARGGALRGAE